MWQAPTMLCALNDHELYVAVDDAVMTMQAIAAGELDEAALAVWLTERLDDWTPDGYLDGAVSIAVRRAVQPSAKGVPG